MSSPISRLLLRTTNRRLYSAQAARKVESAVDAVKVGKENGVSVSTLPNYSPLCRVTVAVKAGSRNEDEGNLGVTHCLRHAVQVANQTNLSFEIIKQLQFMAGRFNVSTTRDATYYNLECFPDQLEASLNIISPIIARTSIDEYNWAEFGGFQQQLERDICMMKQQPNIEVTELLHSAAYRGSLGNSLFAQQQFIEGFNPEMLLNFTNSTYQPGRMSIVGMGIEYDDLASFASSMVFGEPGTPNDRKAKYVGGERRENRPTSDLTYAAIATEAPSLGNKDLIPALILKELMHSENNIKWSNSLKSRLGLAVSKVTDTEFDVSSFGANYTDSGLFGFVLGAEPQEMEKVLKAAVAEFATVTKKGFTDEEVQVAKTQAKVNLVEFLESPEGQLQGMADQLLGSDNVSGSPDVLGLIDGVKTSEVNNVANKIINGKPSMSAVGNLIATPFMDELF